MGIYIWLIMDRIIYSQRYYSGIITMKAVLLILLVVALAVSGCVEKQISPPTSTPTPPSPISTIQPAQTSIPAPTPAAPTTAQPTSTPAAVAVEISGFAYNPATITIPKGTTVVWTQKDNVSHTVTIASGSGFDSGPLSQGQTFKYTFNKAGTFDYGCSIHPYMSGKIMVK
jgi:plastocyanin